MTIKLDENLPDDLAPILGALGHDVETVPSEHMTGADDSAVWAAAQRESRFLITQDLDFSDARKYSPGTHFGLMLLRLRVASRSALIRRVDHVARNYELGLWTKCFVVVTDQKIRVRRP